MSATPSRRLRGEAAMTDAEASREIERLNGQDVAATRRMLRLVEETRVVANHVTETVQEQGQQISRTHDMLAGINKTLRAMKMSLTGAMKIGQEEEANAKDKRAARKGGAKQKDQSPGAPAAGKKDEEREIHDNLDQIDLMVRDIKAQAEGMGEELDRQKHELHKVEASLQSGFAMVKGRTKATARELQWWSGLKKVEDDLKMGIIAKAGLR